MYIFYVGVYPFRLFSVYIEAYIYRWTYTIHTILQYDFFLLITYIVNII